MQQQDNGWSFEMSVSQLQGYSAYREAQENEYEQSELILMMYRGAVNFLEKALAVAEHDPSAMTAFLSKAKKVLLELMASLNLEEGGEVGRLLMDTYTRQFHTLHVAQMTDNTEKVALVRDSLIELEDAWKEVFKSDEYLAFKQKSKRVSRNASFKG